VLFRSRKGLFSLVLMMITLGTFASALSGPTQALGILFMIGFWRVFLGIGIGGDYSLSGVMTSEYAEADMRGMMVAAVFAMQGVGILMAAIVSVIVVAIFRTGIEEDPVYWLDITWRVCVAIGGIPGLIGIYYRLQVKESPRYTAAHGDRARAVHDLQEVNGEDQSENAEKHENEKIIEADENTQDSTTFFQYFRKWKNFKVLLGTAGAWFALDVGFYGTNLNSPTILGIIGFGKGNTIFNNVWNVCLGNLVICLLGAVPGYWVTVFTIEKLGRKPIQYFGFGMLTVLFAILAVGYHWLIENSLPLFITIYTLIQFFNNFGPNATTFVLAGEVFPTRLRTSAHGVSAASGKAGAILAAHGFSIMKDYGGEVGSGAFVPTLLWIFSGFMLLGGCLTYFVPETKGRTLEDISGEKELEM